jgi:hypothetical protein
MLAATWEAESGERDDAERFFQVMTLRGGRIIAIKDCRNRRKALKRLRA